MKNMNGNPLLYSTKKQLDDFDHFELLTNAFELDELEKLWGNLTMCTLPTHQFSWIKACASIFSSNGALKVAILRTHEKLLAVAPFIKRPMNKISRLEMLGLRELNEPMDLIWADRSALEKLASILARSRTSLSLGRLPADSSSIEAIKRAFRGKGVVICQTQSSYPFIPLDEKWKVPEQNLSSRRGSDLRRAYRRAESIGQIRIDVLSPQPNKLDSLLDLAFAIEGNSWKGRAGSAMAKDAARGKFFRQYAFNASRDGSLRMCFMHIGNRAAAMQIALEYGDRFWLLKIGYDEQFANCSPGNLLLRETIKYAAEKGLGSYEFLGTVQPWTLIWTKYQHSCISLRAYPFGVHGMVGLGTDILVALSHRLKGVVPWEKRKHIYSE